MCSFDRNVFVNCPFDEDYRQLLIPIIFTIKYLGYFPRLSLERANSGETRIEKITALINESKFGIHDLSRIVSKETDEHFRMNMPFELGIDYGCQKLKEGIWSSKKILILEEEKYRYKKALSDLSGSDIKNHKNKPYLVIQAVRDWFVTEEGLHTYGAAKIWNDYNDFQAFLYDEFVEKLGHSSVDDVQISEIINCISSWITSNV